MLKYESEGGEPALRKVTGWAGIYFNFVAQHHHHLATTKKQSEMYSRLVTLTKSWATDWQ